MLQCAEEFVEGVYLRFGLHVCNLLIHSVVVGLFCHVADDAEGDRQLQFRFCAAGFHVAVLPHEGEHAMERGVSEGSIVGEHARVVGRHYGEVR